MVKPGTKGGERTCGQKQDEKQGKRNKDFGQKCKDEDIRGKEVD